MLLIEPVMAREELLLPVAPGALPASAATPSASRVRLPCRAERVTVTSALPASGSATTMLVKAREASSCMDWAPGTVSVGGRLTPATVMVAVLVLLTSPAASIA